MRSRILPSLWNNTARRSTLLAAPLFSPVWLRWRSAGSDNHRNVNRVRSFLPSARNARDSAFPAPAAASLRRMTDGTTVPASKKAFSPISSAHCPRIAAVSTVPPIRTTHLKREHSRLPVADVSFRKQFQVDAGTGRMMMQMVVEAFTEFERAMIRERTSEGLAAARAERRIGRRRKKLDHMKRREIAESVVSGRKSAADMARLYGVSQPTVSRIVAAHLAGRA